MEGPSGALQEAGRDRDAKAAQCNVAAKSTVAIASSLKLSFSGPSSGPLRATMVIGRALHPHPHPKNVYDSPVLLLPLQAVRGYFPVA